MNFDQLKAQWQADDVELEQRVQLDKDALKKHLQQQSQKAFGRLRWFKRAEILSNLIVALLLILFCLSNFADLRLLLCGGGVLLVQIWYAKIAWTQQQELNAVDYSQAINDVQQHLEQLRERRLLRSKLPVVVGFALWGPFSIVLLKGLFGVNAFRLFGDSVVLYYFLSGIVLALLLWLVWTAIAAITPQYRWLQQLRQEGVGRQFNAAINFLQTATHLERTSATLLSDETRRCMIKLRRAPLLSIYSKALFILIIGVGNMMHGGQASWLIPGIILTVFLGTQIAFSALQLTLLKRAQQCLDSSTLWSAMDAYNDAVDKNFKWLLASLPITASALLLLLLKLSGVMLSAGVLLAVFVIATMLSAAMMKIKMSSPAQRWRFYSLNKLSGGAYFSLMTQLEQRQQDR